MFWLVSVIEKMMKKFCIILDIGEVLVGVGWMKMREYEKE